MNRHFTKEDVEMTEYICDKVLNNISDGEMQIKTKKTDSIRRCQGYAETGMPLLVVVQKVTTLWIKVWLFLINLNINPPVAQERHSKIFT